MAILYKKVCSKIVGREKEVKLILAALAAGRHLILEGPPGTSKSTILKTIAEESGLPFYMVMGNSDLTSTKLLGYFDPARALKEGYKIENYEYGPLSRAMIEGGFLYIEEFNRMPEDATNVLITAMSEGELSIPRVGMIKSKPTFRVIAAMNPYDDVGVNKLSRALRDRFCSIKMDYQSMEEEVKIVKLRTGSRNMKLIEDAVKISRRTRNHPDVRLGASVRGAIDMVLIAEKLLSADVKNLDEDCEELILQAAITAMRDKIWMMETSEKTPEDVIKEIWNMIKAEEKTLNKEGNIAEKTSVDRATDSFEGGGENDDNQSEIKRDEFNAQKSLTFKENPEYIQKILEKPILFYQWLKADNNDVDNKFELNWDELDPQTKKFFMNFLIRIILKMAQLLDKSIDRGVLLGEPKPVKYRFNSDELDLDRTVERIMAKIFPEYSDFIVFEREPRKRACVLMLDCSGSMRGWKKIQAALATATLAMSLRDEEYAVLLFSDKSEMLKTLNQTKPVQEVIEKILNVNAEGCTNIRSGLELGLSELQKASGTSKKLGILISDGWQNIGEDPVVIAQKYPELNVIGLPYGDSETCQKLADAGRGRCVIIKNLAELPRALKLCLD